MVRYALGVVGALCAGLLAAGQGAGKTSAGVTQVVTPQAPLIRWAPGPVIASNDPLTELDLNATATVSGRFTYSPGPGATLTAGTQTLTARFIPDDPNYATATQPATVTVVDDDGTEFRLRRSAAKPVVARTAQYADSTVGVEVSPDAAFYPLVRLSCETTAGIACTVKPRLLRLGRATTTVQVQVRVPDFFLWELHAEAGLLPCVGLLLVRRRRRSAWLPACAATMLCVGGALSGCGEVRPIHIVLVAKASTHMRTLPLDLYALGLKH